MPTENQLTRRGVLKRSAAAAAAVTAGRALTADKARAADAPAPEKRPWLVGCYTRPWDGYDYRVALDAIAQAGYRHAGLMTTKSKTRLVISVATTPDEAQAVAAELKKRKLTVPSVYGGGIPVAKSLKAGIAALRTLIDRCAVVGAKSLLMGGTGAAHYDAYYKAIAECCDYAADKGMEIAVKPHGGLNATGPQCRKCIERVAHRNFRLWYDPGNIYYYSSGKLNPVEDAAAVDGLVTGMCVKDYRPPKDVWLTPGTGKVDFPAVLRRLKRGGFTGGPLVVECVERLDPRAKTKTTPEQRLAKIAAEARKARLFLEKLVAELG